MNIRFICFYTKEYKEESEGLRATLDQFSLDHCICSKPSKGTWIDNVRRKPLFIFEMMKKFPKADAVVWIDADGRVKRYPELLFKLEKVDLAAHMFQRRQRSGESLLSGTLFVRNSSQMHDVMKIWIREVSKSSRTLLYPEQLVLQRILPSLGVKFYRLPYSYCKIYDTKSYPEEILKNTRVVPVIEHYQASRKYVSKMRKFKEKRL